MTGNSGNDKNGEIGGYEQLNEEIPFRENRVKDDDTLECEILGRFNNVNPVKKTGRESFQLTYTGIVPRV